MGTRIPVRLGPGSGNVRGVATEVSWPSDCIISRRRVDWMDKVVGSVLPAPRLLTEAAAVSFRMKPSDAATDENLVDTLTGWSREKANMMAEDLDKVIGAMVLRNDGRWCAPSGAFLDLLRQFAKENKIAEMAESCRMYFSVYHGARKFVASRLPAIIVNNYKPLTVECSSTMFLKWSEQNADWAERIRRNACSPGLASVIDNMSISIRRFLKFGAIGPAARP